MVVDGYTWSRLPGTDVEMQGPDRQTAGAAIPTIATPAMTCPIQATYACKTGPSGVPHGSAPEAHLVIVTTTV